MNPRESFTLRPSSAFSSYDDASKENQFRPIVPSMIPGTIRQDWSGARPRPVVDPEAGLGIRASPFEPLIRDRNLPKCGTISPLSSEEYKAWVHARSTSPNVVASQAATATKDAAASCKILLPKECNIVVEEDNGESSWRLRFLLSEMSRTQTRINMLALMEEKRQMRIKLLALEAMLNDKGSHGMGNDGKLEETCNEGSPKNMNASIVSEAKDKVNDGIIHADDTPCEPPNQPPCVEAEESILSNQTDVCNDRSHVCEEAWNYVNLTRGDHMCSSMESESLHEAFQLDSSSERLSASLDTTTSTTDRQILEASPIDSVKEQGSTLPGKNPVANESNIEQDTNALHLDNATVKASDMEAARVRANESTADARITRSRLRRKDAEQHIEDDAVPTSASKKYKAHKEDEIRVSLDHVSTEVASSNETREETKDLEETEEKTPPVLDSKEQTGRKVSPKKKGKRKRNIKGDLFSSFQAPALKKQTRRRT